MPPVPGFEGAFIAEPDSDEKAGLDARWVLGEFAARVSGKVIEAGADKPMTLYVPNGLDPQLVGGMLAMLEAIPAPEDAFYTQKIEWRKP